MALPVYLAMTAAEMRDFSSLPPRCAWMACHFSSYGLGLSNIPRQLPQSSLLILNDRTPVREHDPQLIALQLKDAVEDLGAEGVLLDLQRPENPQTAAVVRGVVQTLSCPVAVTQCYAEDLPCAVFLETPRPYHPLSRQIKKWEGRELWLEAAFNGGSVTVTKEGSRYCPDGSFADDSTVYSAEALYCHYAIKKAGDCVVFSFRRTADDLRSLLKQAESLGIRRAVGLYQELGEEFL